MSEIDYSKPIAGESRKGLSAVPGTMWILVVVIAVMALAIGYLLGSRGAATSTDAAATAEQAAATATDEANHDVVSPKPGKGAHLWGGAKPLSQITQASDVHRRNPDDPFAVGKVDAPVVISEFSDFECPFCSRYANQTAPALMKYVEDGTVRIEWNDLAINGPHAEAGAMAGRAAAAQGKFEEYKTAAYNASKGVSGHPNFEIDDFVGFAKKAGVKDIDKFRQQATDGTFADDVKNASDFASKIGMSGTPGFIIGDQFISGAQPLEVFEKAIKEELAKAKNG